MTNYCLSLNTWYPDVIKLSGVSSGTLIAVSSDLTPEGYNRETVAKILAAKQSALSAAQISGDEFLGWLNK
jgi:hypothetical protein